MFTSKQKVSAATPLTAALTAAVRELAHAQCPDDEIASKISADFDGIDEDDALAMLTDDASPWKKLVASWRRAGIATIRKAMYDVATKDTASKEGAGLATSLARHYAGVGDEASARKAKKALEEARRSPQRVLARIRAHEKAAPSLGILGKLPPAASETPDE